MNTQTIKVRQGMLWRTIILAALLFSLGISVFLSEPNGRILGALLALFSGGMIILSLPNFSSVVNINWNNESLSGPNALMRLSRHNMKWSEIVKIGVTPNAIYFVEDNNQQRIYFSKSYKNIHEFEAFLTKKRPNLIWPSPNNK